MDVEESGPRSLGVFFTSYLEQPGRNRMELVRLSGIDVLSPSFSLFLPTAKGRGATGGGNFDPTNELTLLLLLLLTNGLTVPILNVALLHFQTI